MAVHYSCPRHALLALHMGALKRIQKKYTGHVLFIFSLIKVAGQSGHYCTTLFVHRGKYCSSTVITPTLRVMTDIEGRLGYSSSAFRSHRSKGATSHIIEEQ
jgi:hypothetical protein